MQPAPPAATRSPTERASSAAASCDLRGVDKGWKDRQALRALLTVLEKSGWRFASCTYGIEELIPRGHQANARRTQRMKGYRAQPRCRKQRKLRRFAQC